MQNAFAPCHFGQVHRKEPRSRSRLKPNVSGVLEDQQQNERSESSKKKGRVRDRAIPVASMKKQGDGKRRDCKNSGHPEARAQPESRKWKRSQAKADAKFDTKTACSQNQKSATRQAQARQKTKVDILVSVTRKAVVQKTRIATIGILHSASFRERDKADHVHTVPSSTSAKTTSRWGPKREPKFDKIKNSNMVATN